MSVVVGQIRTYAALLLGVALVAGCSSGGGGKGQRGQQHIVDLSVIDVRHIL
jgi:hypothetical protein